jgi:hypothetical protein
MGIEEAAGGCGRQDGLSVVTLHGVVLYSVALKVFSDGHDLRDGRCAVTFAELLRGEIRRDGASEGRWRRRCMRGRPAMRPDLW